MTSHHEAAAAANRTAAAAIRAYIDAIINNRGEDDAEEAMDAATEAALIASEAADTTAMIKGRATPGYDAAVEAADALNNEDLELAAQEHDAAAKAHDAQG